MSKSDVEMDDAEKLHDDSGNNIQESKSKPVDPKVDDSGNSIQESESKLVDPKVDDSGNNIQESECKLVDPKVDDSGNNIQESECKLVDPKVDDSGNNIQESECKLVDPKVDDSENNIQESECKLVDPKVDDSGNSIQESECKVMDPKVQHKEEVPCATAALGDVNGRDQGGEDLNKCRDEDKDEMNVKTEVNDQTNPVNEASEPIEGSDCAIIITKSENKELVNTETEPEAQTVATTAVEIQSDLKNEVVEPEATNYLVKENESTKNDVVDESHRENVERPIEDVLEKKPKEIGEVLKDTENTEHVAGEAMVENADSGTVSAENRQLSTEFSGNKDPQGQDAKLDDVRPGDDEEMEDAVHFDQDKMVRDEEQGVKTLPVNHEIDGNDKTLETAAKLDAEESSAVNQHEAATPFVRCSSAKATDHCGESSRVVFTQATLPLMGEDDDGTPEDQAAFMKELEHFFREKTMDFKPPKFYGQPLNCLKLWKAVIRLGGYDRVTGSKLWRQVGESFHPPKTCTTVSWTFRIFYEKSLLEYERHKTQSGELQLPIPMLPEVSGGDIEGNGHQGSGLGSGRARRDAASRAMQGWHVQRLVAGEVGDPIVKDKDLNNMAKNDKNLKSIGSLKQKRPNEVEHSSKAARTDVSKQLVTSVVDVGSPADWVKINVRQTKECFEVYALVPGLLREEVRVQSDPAGRLVITGQPEQVDNPWGITPFKKVISLPARIDPVNTSAVVSLHGRLLVRVPFEQPNI